MGEITAAAPDSKIGGGNDDGVFVGRHAELARLAEAAAEVRAGRPLLVSIEGESGVGKTVLAQRAVAALADATVLSARAVPMETDFDYGVVDQLLRRADRDLLARYSSLPGDASISPFGVGAQLLGLVGELETRGPVVLLVDDVQWADRRSVEALGFVLRRLSVDAVMAVVVVRGDRSHLDESSRRLLVSAERSLRLSLSGLGLEDVAPLAAALGAEALTPGEIELLHASTGGHTLYLHTVLSDTERLHPGSDGRLAVPASLIAAIGGQLATLSADARRLVEMLAVVNTRVPLARLAAAAGCDAPSEALEPAVRAGLVDWWPDQPTCPVAIRHALQRDAIYGALAPIRRRQLHARAVDFVDEMASWMHRVAALDHPDEDLASQLEGVAADEAAAGHLCVAATHLQWASEVSPDRADRDRRLLTAALHLMQGEHARGLALQEAVTSTAPSPLRSCVLGTMAFASGQLGLAELTFGEALAGARREGGDQTLAARIATRLASTFILLGEGQKVMDLVHWALETGRLDAAAESQTRTLAAIGASQVGGARVALGELSHLDPDPSRVEAVHVDGLSFRGVFHLLAGNLSLAVADLTASFGMVRKGATMTLGVRTYCYATMAQYLAGAWDAALLTVEQGFSLARIHSRRVELPLLHLAASVVPAGRGLSSDAERHARLAEEAAATLEYGQERLYASMARALVCQASADYAGIASAMVEWLDDALLDGRTRLYAVLWRPLLVEGLIGSGRVDDATSALELLELEGRAVRFLQPALAWLGGWLAEVKGELEKAERIYQKGDDALGESPVYDARLLLAHGRLLRRTGRRRPAIERLRRAQELYRSLRADPFIARTEEELVACGLSHAAGGRHRSALTLTNRETDVAHLVARGMTTREIAAELYVTPKAVEYHLGNIYAKVGVNSRQQLRHSLIEIEHSTER